MSVQDTVGSDIAFAAVLHLAQTVPDRYLRCILDVRSMVTLKTADIDVSVDNDRICAPHKPGLGISPIMSTLGDPVSQYS